MIRKIIKKFFGLKEPTLTEKLTKAYQGITIQILEARAYNDLLFAKISIMNFSDWVATLEDEDLKQTYTLKVLRLNKRWKNKYNEFNKKEEYKLKKGLKNESQEKN